MVSFPVTKLDDFGWEFLTVSLLMASFASYGNDRFRHGYSTFSQSFLTRLWLCVTLESWFRFSGEITKEVSREIQECEAMKKTLVVYGI